MKRHLKAAEGVFIITILIIFLVCPGLYAANSSTTAFSVLEKDLIPEGITYDPVEQAFFLSSLYKSKIIKIDNKGNRSDFTKERQDGSATSPRDESGSE